MHRSDGIVEKLIDELLARIEEPQHQARKEAPYPRFTCYVENMGWAQLFGYDVTRYRQDACFSCAQQVREKLYHLDHFADDTAIGPDVSVPQSWFEYTLVGLDVHHQADGVPLIQESGPLTRAPDIRLLKPHNFYRTGTMPQILRLYDELSALVKERLHVTFPTWSRGPLDMAIQLRGYGQFVLDTIDRPAFVHDLIKYLVEERIRWWDAYCAYLGMSDRSAWIMDDWINAPFISPSVFRDFVLPYYLELEQYHGTIRHVHACGNQGPMQRYLLQLKSLPELEGNHWTDLAATVRTVPRGKRLIISLLSTEVLLADESEMEGRLRQIADLCYDREYKVEATGITMIHSDFAQDIAQVQRWLEVARKVSGRSSHC